MLDFMLDLDPALSQQVFHTPSKFSALLADEDAIEQDTEQLEGQDET